MFFPLDSPYSVLVISKLFNSLSDRNCESDIVLTPVKNVDSDSLTVSAIVRYHIIYCQYIYEVY